MVDFTKVEEDREDVFSLLYTHDRRCPNTALDDGSRSTSTHSPSLSIGFISELGGYSN
jgi:hypothetical protein